MTDPEINTAMVKLATITRPEELERCCNLFAQKAADYHRFGSIYGQEHAETYARFALICRLALVHYGARP